MGPFNKDKKTLSQFLLQTIFVLCFTFSIIILSVNFTLIFKPLYYADIEILQIEESTNLNKMELKANYDYLITYLTQTKTPEFNLPTLPSSDNGKTHFKEVKVIFDKLKLILIISVIISIIGVILNKRRKNNRYLLTSSILLLIMPIALLFPFLIDFDKSFTTFHHIFFRNDYWLFDVELDPIINILPQNFFFHCAILILFLITITSIILRRIYKASEKNS